VVLSPSEIRDVAPSTRPGESSVTVTLAPGIEVDAARFQRSMFVSSSCGVCGKASIENVRLLARPPGAYAVTRGTLAGLTGALRRHQPTFDETGGLHAAGVFSRDGDLVAAREDVGRHNAADKAIGGAARAAWPLPPSVLVVSGRVSFEIVQKAAMAGIGAVVGVSAPSSLAVDLARELGMLLAGFARDGAFNVYAGDGRLGP
jgi:FdhD protein